MYIYETIPASYLEERAREDELKRLATRQAEAMQKSQEQFQAQNRPPPQNLTQAILQRPPIAMPGSSGLLGNIFQGFVKAAAATPNSPAHTPCATPLPGQSKELNSASVSKEMERLIKDRKVEPEVICWPL